jgi:hypothetical protein
MNINKVIPINKVGIVVEMTVSSSNGVGKTSLTHLLNIYEFSQVDKKTIKRSILISK